MCGGTVAHIERKRHGPPRPRAPGPGVRAHGPARMPPNTCRPTTANTTRNSSSSTAMDMNDDRTDSITCAGERVRGGVSGGGRQEACHKGISGV